MQSQGQRTTRQHGGVPEEGESTGSERQPEGVSRKGSPPFLRYRGTSLIKNTHPPRITLGPEAWGFCRVLRGLRFLGAKHPCTPPFMKYSSVLMNGALALWLHSKGATHAISRSGFEHSLLQFLSLKSSTTQSVLLVQIFNGHPHGGPRSFHQKSTCIAQST